MTKTLELPVSDLKHALVGLAKIIGTRPGLPILGHVSVEPDGADAVYLHATDLETFATCRIPARNLEQFPACTVAFDQLNKLVKTSKADLALLREDDGKLLVRYAIGGSVARTSIESLDLAEWPPLPAIQATASLLEDGFKSAFKQALECSSTDSSRYVFQGACLDVSQKGCHCVVGTDGRHLFSANTFTFPITKSVIVPHRKFLTWSGFVEDGAWHLAVEPDKEGNPDWVKLHSNRWTVITKAIAGAYPNWRQIITPQEGKTRIVFSPAAVTTMLDTLPCLPTWSDVNLPVRLEAVNNQLCLKGRTKENEDWTTVPVPDVNIVGSGLTVTLNRTLLSKALRFGFTEFEYYSETEPVRFTAPGRKLIVMPLGMSTPEPSRQTAETPEVGAPSATQAEPTTTEETKTMTTKKISDSPMKDVVDQIEKIKETLKSVINEFTTVLAAIKVAEKEKKATEKEVEAIRATLRSLQRVQI